jgi:4-diphosphocytidyl-2-C-methyl-D-erythritol kinase
MRAVSVTAPAKINLILSVGAARSDGFHPLATVYMAIGLYDRVTVSPAPETVVHVHGDDRLDLSGVPTDERNLAFRAARLLGEHHGRDESVSVSIDKGIPVAGGMAGGSADAAATLLACDTLWDTQTPREELALLAAELGSDVPFALVGGTALGSGRGEVVNPVMARGEFWWVVMEADDGLSTADVYREFDSLHRGAVRAEPEVPLEIFGALTRHDVEALGAALTNDLQPAALRLRPDLQESLNIGREESALGALLSGSGPTCLFLCESRAHADNVADGLVSHGLGPVSIAPGPVPGARVVAMRH